MSEVIVVAVDGSPESDAAVEWAAHEAVRRAGVLRIAHVWHSPALPTDPVLVMPNEQYAIVDAAAEIAREAEPSVTIEVRTEGGAPSPTLLRIARGASLIVLGGHHRRFLDRVVFGSVTTSVLARARCPVIVVRPSRAESAITPGPVVVGVDHGGTSDDAVEFGLGFAESRGLDLVAIQAWSDEQLTVKDTSASATVRTVRESLRDGIRPLHDRHPSVDVITVAACESPVDALLDWSETASLLVVGSRVHGYLNRMLLGSVSSAIAHRASCSVAIVRTRSRQQLPDSVAS